VFRLFFANWLTQNVHGYSLANFLAGIAHSFGRTGNLPLPPIRKLVVSILSPDLVTVPFSLFLTFLSMVPVAVLSLVPWWCPWW